MTRSKSNITRFLFALSLMLSAVSALILSTDSAAAVSATQFRDAKCVYLTQWLEDRGIDPTGDGVDLQEWMADHASPRDGVDAPATRYRQNLFQCADQVMVLDGLILNGPQQDASGIVDINVGKGEAVDSCDPETPGCVAVYSDEPTRIGQNTLRARKGMVSGDTWTWYIVDDEAFVKALESGKTPTPPAPGEASDTGNTDNVGGNATETPDTASADVPDIGCPTDPEELATKLGDGVTYKEVADATYGGLRFELAEDTVLPKDYEAIGPGGIRIEFNTAGKDARTMTAGFWTVYYPRGECRANQDFKD